MEEKTKASGPVGVANILPAHIVSNLINAAKVSDERQRVIAIDRAVTAARILNPEFFISEPRSFDNE